MKEINGKMATKMERCINHVIGRALDEVEAFVDQNYPTTIKKMASYYLGHAVYHTLAGIKSERRGNDFLDSVGMKFKVAWDVFGSITPPFPGAERICVYSDELYESEDIGIGTEYAWIVSVNCAWDMIELFNEYGSFAITYENIYSKETNQPIYSLEITTRMEEFLEDEGYVMPF